MTEKEVVNPERLYCPLFVTPAIFKPGSMVLKAFGILIKNFGNDRERETLYVFPPPPSVKTWIPA